VLRLEPRAAAQAGVEVVQPRRDLAREQQAVVGERVEGDRRFVRDRVLHGEQGHDAFAPDRLVGQCGDDVGEQCEGRVDRSGAEGLRHAARAHLLGQQLEVGMAALERLAHRRQGLEARAPVVGDADAAELAGGCATSRRQGSIGLRDHAPRAIEQRHARLGEPDLATATDEQARTDLLLELADRHAERRLRHVQPLGRAAEIQFLGDGDEVAEVPKLRHHPSVARRSARNDERLGGAPTGLITAFSRAGGRA
jgi:hypothetical protein